MIGKYPFFKQKRCDAKFIKQQKLKITTSNCDKCFYDENQFQSNYYVVKEMALVLWLR